MKRRFDLYLNDILEAVGKIQTYTDGLDFHTFIKNSLVVEAVLRNLEIIGEAARQLQQEIKEKYVGIPWRDIQDFRIIVAHRYWEINKERVWDIIQNKLDPLRRQMEAILQKEQSK